MQLLTLQHPHFPVDAFPGIPAGIRQRGPPDGHLNLVFLPVVEEFIDPQGTGRVAAAVLCREDAVDENGGVHINAVKIQIMDPLPLLPGNKEGPGILQLLPVEIGHTRP